MTETWRDALTGFLKEIEDECCNQIYSTPKCLTDCPLEKARRSLPPRQRICCEELRERLDSGEMILKDRRLHLRQPRFIPNEIVARFCPFCGLERGAR